MFCCKVNRFCISATFKPYFDQFNERYDLKNWNPLHVFQILIVYSMPKLIWQIVSILQPVRFALAYCSAMWALIGLRIPAHCHLWHQRVIIHLEWKKFPVGWHHQVQSTTTAFDKDLETSTKSALSTSSVPIGSPPSIRGAHCTIRGKACRVVALSSPHVPPLI